MPGAEERGAAVRDVALHANFYDGRVRRWLYVDVESRTLPDVLVSVGKDGKDAGAWAEGRDVFDWSVLTEAHGWQEAYNVMVTRDDELWEPEEAFTAYVCRTLSGGNTFEAMGGEGARIVIVYSE